MMGKKGIACMKNLDYKSIEPSSTISVMEQVKNWGRKIRSHSTFRIETRGARTGMCPCHTIVDTMLAGITQLICGWWDGNNNTSE